MEVSGVSGVGGVGGRTSPLAADERRSSTSGSSGRLATEETLAYTVHGSDTLTSVAARFDTTPSELVSLNKLNSRLIFPGQVNDFAINDAYKSTKTLHLSLSLSLSLLFIIIIIYLHLFFEIYLLLIFFTSFITHTHTHTHTSIYLLSTCFFSGFRSPSIVEEEGGAGREEGGGGFL